MTAKENKDLPAKRAEGTGAVVAADLDYGEQAGLGFENTTAADYAIPFINLLQQLSPECQEDPTTKVDGAKPGMFINSVNGELIDGTSGFLFVPVDTAHCWVEWVPREKGGGWVAVHDLDSPLVKEAKSRAEAFNKVQTEAGNDLIDTFYVYGYLLANEESIEPTEAVVLAFTSTKQKPYRTVMSELRKSKARPPLWANRLRVTSFPTKNKAGQPYHNVVMKPMKAASEHLTAQENSLIPPRLDGEKHPLLKHGKDLNEQVRSGAARAAFESVSGGNGDGDKPPF